MLRTAPSRSATTTAAEPFTRTAAARRITRTICFALILLGMARPAAAQKQEPPPAQSVKAPPGDTSKSVQPMTAPAGHPAQDSVSAHPDSLGRMTSPSLVGTIDRWADSSSIITQKQLHWLDYTYLGGIVQGVPGVSIRDQNSAEQENQLNIRGADWRSIAIMMDGRLLNDPASGIYNLYYFTPEFADRIEVVTGPRAFLYGLNSSGGAVNFVTKNYNSNKPYTKFIYSESSYNYQFSDGTFSQNISRKVNITVGFQHQGTDGRYSNSAGDLWNARVKARYNISRDLNIILSEYFTSAQTQFNGGINLPLAGEVNAFDPNSALTVDSSAYEKVTRHDLDLSLVGTLLGDTADVSALTLYYSHNVREYRSGENLASGSAEPFIHSDHTSSWMGMLLTQDITTGAQRFSLGGNLEIRQIEGSPNLGRRRNVIGNIRAKEDFLLGEALTVSGYARYDTYLRKQYFGAGGDATLRIHDLVSLFGGLSFSRRLPGYEELFWNDSTVSRTDPIVAEKHREAEAGATLHLPSAGDIRVALFHRTVEDAITIEPYGNSIHFPGLRFANSGRIVSDGIETRIDLRAWVLRLEATGTYLLQAENGTDIRRLPRLSAIGGVYYRNTILEDKLDLKAGLNARFMSAQQGETFNPEVPAYVANPGTPLGYSASVDLVVIARLGDAYIHLVMQNLTDVKYFAAPYYPALDRAFRFGVDWEFLN